MKFMTVAAVLGITVAAMLPDSAAASTAGKVRLQAAMQQHIETLTIDGAILHLDTASGEVVELFPTQAHPVIMTMGDHFVLCADLKNAAGRSLPIDLYMTADGQRYVAFHTEIDNRSALQEMIKRGQVQQLK